MRFGLIRCVASPLLPALDVCQPFGRSAGLPLFVLSSFAAPRLCLIFFVMPLPGISLPKFEAGFLSVGLTVGACPAEIVRGTIEALPQPASAS